MFIRFDEGGKNEESHGGIVEVFLSVDRDSEFFKNGAYFRDERKEIPN